MVVRFDNRALRQRKNEAAMGVDGDQATLKGGVTEADAIVAHAKKSVGPELNIEAAKAAQKNPV
jgi:protein phosphatase PTC1